MPLPPITSNLVFWLDARDITGKSDGQTISTWNDSTGHGHTATVATGTATYRTNQYNNNPALTLASCNMTIAGMGGVTATDAHTSFLVYKLSNAATGNQAILGAQATNSYQHVLAYARFNTTIVMQGVWQDFIAFGSNWTGTAAADTNWHQANAWQNGNVSVGFRLDQATDTTQTGSTLDNLNPPDAIGKLSGSGNVSLQVMLIGYYNTVLSLSDIQAVEVAIATPGFIQPQVFVVTRQRLKEAARKVRRAIPSVLPDFTLQPSGLWAR